MSYGSLEPDPLLQGVNSVVTYHWTQAWIVALQLPLAHQDPRGAHFAERGTFCMQTQAEVEVRVRIASSERSWSLQICSWPPAAASPGPVGFLFHASDQFWPPPAWASLEAMVVTIFVYKKKYMRTAYREKGETVLGVLMSEGCWACGQPQIFGCWAAPGSGMGTFEMCQSLGKWRSAEAVFAARVRYHPLLQKSEGGAGLGGGLTSTFAAQRCLQAGRLHPPFAVKPTSKTSQIRSSSNWWARTETLAVRRTLGWEWGVWQMSFPFGVSVCAEGLPMWVDCPKHLGIFLQDGWRVRGCSYPRRSPPGQAEVPKNGCRIGKKWFCTHQWNLPGSHGVTWTHGLSLS